MATTRYDPCVHFLGSVNDGPINTRPGDFLIDLATGRGYRMDARNIRQPLVSGTTGAFTVDSGGLTVTAGGATITAGGLRVTAGRVVENLSVANITTAAATTYSAANLAAGIITRDPNGGARTDVTDTAAAIIGGTPALSSDGDCLLTWLINTADAAEAITISGGTDVTVVNAAQTLLQNEAALMIFRRTAATTISLYLVGA